MAAPQVPHTGLVHEALVYQDLDEYVTGITGFLHMGLDRDEPGLVALPGARLDLIRSAMGADARKIRFADITEVGRNPGSLIPRVLYAFALAHAGRRVRIVGEPAWPGRNPAEYPAVVQHEALVNVALADQQVTILCAYDGRALTEPDLAAARRTHPLLIEDGVQTSSDEYTDPRVVADASLRSLPEQPDLWGDMLVFSSPADLREVRRFVTTMASRAGLPPERVSDLCLAVNEVATNTLLHTGDPGVVSIWQDTGLMSVVCEISDSGQLADRLAGRIPPPATAPHGRGLILVHSLCDLVELPTGRIGGGNTVRLHMRLPVAQQAG